MIILFVAAIVDAYQVTKDLSDNGKEITIKS